MNRLDPSRSIAVLLVLLVCSGCDVRPGSTELVERSDSAGVSLVHNLSADRPVAIRYETVVTLGGKDTAEESFYLVSSWTVGTDRSGNIYILDSSSYRVHAFEPSGQHIRTMGGQGSGPGELAIPQLISVSEEGGVRVMDLAKSSFVQWGPTGESEPSVPIPEGYRGGLSRWVDDGMVIPLRDAEGQYLSLVLTTSGAETRFASILGAIEPIAIRLPSCGMSFTGLPPIFSPTFVWTASGSTVVVGSSTDYVLDVYHEGRLQRSIRRDLPRRAATAALAAESLGEGMRVLTVGGERTCDPIEVVEQQGFAEWLPTLKGVALAPDGRIWVERYEIGDRPGPIDIFEADGSYLGTIPEGESLPIGFLPEGRLLSVHIDEFDVQRLVIRNYEIGG